ncbi:uncharacterized protein LOC117811192 [Notolabrus celidotus]|uniref:uncharacterized protein LOC117811192 n=1 Tax=Notolabrus celidotus TaxID=1203425 RepID=UPI0014906114|nr:uncharacterized protein LOC117811192 [Notolabrus celidotus]
MMSGRSFSESWRLLDQLSGNPTWQQSYSVCKTEWHFQEDSENVMSTAEFTTDGPLENDFVIPEKEEPCSSASSSSEATVFFPETSPPPQYRAPRHTHRATEKMRRRRAAVSHPYKARGYHVNIAPTSTGHRCGGFCCSCSQRRYKPWDIMARRARLRAATVAPNVPAGQHLPVTIHPTRWFQVVGSLQCEHCKAKGRYQMTSWMCQLCMVPLCLMPFRNCYSAWHAQGY